jgi:predicted DCC family thiol-disulfide oxidoreductase YuxK
VETCKCWDNNKFTFLNISLRTNNETTQITFNKKKQHMSSNHPILLFDGVCNLCNGFVQFIIRRDPEARFRFASLQSEAVALRVLPQLNGFWSWTQIFWLVPRSWRDAGYNWVARNRYRWFGQKDACMIPTPELRNRFL